MLVTDTAGGTLQGVIDGTNKTYKVSLDPALDSLQVVVNGRIKVASLDDGYALPGGRTIVLKEALLDGDTLEICYELAGESSLGGAPHVGQAVTMAKTCPISPVLSAQPCELAPPTLRARARVDCP